MTSKLVKKLAKELAGAFYDGQDTLNDNRIGRSDAFRQQQISQKLFVTTLWPHFVKAARMILAEMLQSPGRSDHERNLIYDALLEERGQRTDEQIAAPNVLRLN